MRRKLDFERPVEPELIEACIALATQAPTGRNAQGWRFLVITEPEKKRAVADLYRRAFAHYRELRAAEPNAEPPKAAYQLLADRMHEMPVLILVCVEGRPESLSVRAAGRVLRLGAAGGLVADAGAARARAGLDLDHAAPACTRTRRRACWAFPRE